VVLKGCRRRGLDQTPTAQHGRCITRALLRLSIERFVSRKLLFVSVETCSRAGRTTRARSVARDWDTENNSLRHCQQAIIFMTSDEKTVLITGGSGYSGQFLVNEFAARGWKVRRIPR
jgi:FlaA1/EpsC-like NDP-sugar epimerase